MRKLSWWVVASLALAACTSKTSGSDSAQPSQAGKAASGGAREPNKLTIALIAKSSSNPVFLAARTGAEAAAKELSAKNNMTISVVWLTPPQEDGQVQAQRVLQAVNDG